MRPALAAAIALAWPFAAVAQQVSPTPTHTSPVSDEAAPTAQEDYAIHGQTTFTDQYHPAFRSPYVGPQSLNPGSRGDETWDVTLYAGVRPWSGAEFWVNPEVNQGFGFSDTFGLAGFPSAESYKLGSEDPYVRIQRLFIRQTIDLGGKAQNLDPDANQLGGTTTANRLVITVGKFSVVDIFDNNKYAHDARGDFLNWSVIDGGWFDYAGDAWGYTYGAAAELYYDRFALRGAVVDTPTTPTYKYLDDRFIGQFQMLMEAEERHSIGGQPGVVRLTGFLTRENLGSFKDALAQTFATGVVTNASDVLNYRSRAGIGINIEQQVMQDVGVFARAGTGDDDSQITSFTDIDQSVSGGVSVSGGRWSRPDDTAGVALVWNNISRHFKNYLNSGAVGILIGDGQLPSSGPEEIIESYYSFAAFKYKGVSSNVTADYQFINNPAYNRQRGPVSALALRLHAEF